ncbi:MAG: 30S ribosomal protein S2 [Planctomycetota bacterium]
MVSVKELVEAGVHFGHRASRWHPQMAKYIYAKHNQIHIIDLRETLKGIIRGNHFLQRLVEAGHEVVFVGTKPQARDVVKEQAQRCGMHFVTTRWLGGTLTNFQTIRSRLRRLEELEAVESDGSVEVRKKKEIAALRRERRKINRNLEGIRRMNRLPGAVVVVDIRRDQSAVREARLLGIPVVGVVDTDCDPRTVDVVIPANDDAYRSIESILRCLADSVITGRDKLHARQEAEEKKRLEDQAEERKRAAEAKAAAATPAAAPAEPVVTSSGAPPSPAAGAPASTRPT